MKNKEIIISERLSGTLFNEKIVGFEPKSHNAEELEDLCIYKHG